jgi:hypothetical protein
MLRKILILSLVTALLTLSVLPGSLQAQSRYYRPGDNVSIPEDDRPWAGAPWLAGIILTAAAMAVGLKNAKRTHLD